nr:MAG: hypothetical protein [Microvirus sp.]
MTAVALRYGLPCVTLEGSRAEPLAFPFTGKPLALLVALSGSDTVTPFSSHNHGVLS